MKEAYIDCLKKLREFRKSLMIDKDIKRGKLYFTWVKDKTKIIENEKNENYIYTNVIKHTLPNYVITRYTFNKANKKVKSIIKENYTFKDNKYTFNNTNISVEDAKIIMKYVLFKRGNVVWIDFGFNIGNEFKIVMYKSLENILYINKVEISERLYYLNLIDAELGTQRVML